MFVLPVSRFPSINPILIAFGPFAVRWYALAYIVGIIAGWFYARAIIASQRLWGGPAPFTASTSMISSSGSRSASFSAAAPAMCCSTICRILPRNPIEIFQLWNGGMSFHGGVIGCVVAIIAVRPASANPDAVARRRHRRRGAHRPVPWPHRQLHQRRILGPSDGRALGNDLSYWRSDPAPPEPALRSRPRRRGAVLRARRVGAARRAEAAGRAHRGVRDRLRRRAHHLRTLSRARHSARLPLGRADDGHAAVHPADPGRHRAPRGRLDTHRTRRKK